MKRIGPPKVGPKKPKLVAKIRRTKVQAYGTFTNWMAVRASIIKRDGNKCRRCGSAEHLQVDHIIPIAKGGQTVDANLWTLCDICHSNRPGHKTAKKLIMHSRNKKLHN